jgi:cell fate regulator YaaT (PSP1 superfamily)
MMEYLVSYGSAGYVGRFQPVGAAAYRRGDRVVLHTRRGVEVGTVLSGAAGGYGDAWSDPLAGELLRPATPADEAPGADPAEAFATARQLAADLGLAIEVIDVETVAEPPTVVLHYLGRPGADLRPFVSGLARHYAASVELLDLTAPAAEEHGCGSCGSGGCGSGGCGDCGSGGGCGSGCGAGKAEEFARDWQAHFAELRARMDQRIPLATVGR